MKKLFVLFSFLFVSSSAFANEAMADGGANYLKYFAFFIAVGMAALGGTIGQSKAATAALEGIARNPGAQDKVFIPMLLALAFMESLVIFTILATKFI